MADIQLNKPLYKTDGGNATDPDFTPPIPRPPRANMIGRAAALFLDVMLLHLLFGAIVRFVPAIPLALGPLAPWVGLLIGFAYFGIGFSNVTLGRTLGKLITRVQVCDIAGPDLPLGRAFGRAALLLWPLPIHLVLGMIAERAGATNPVSILTTIEIFGTMLIAGWAIGNLGFAAMDPYKRTVYDRLVQSIVINAELEPAPVAEYLAGARQANERPPQRGSILFLGGALSVCLAFATASGISVMRDLKAFTPEQKASFQARTYPGFGMAVPAATLEQVSTDTLPLALHFRRRGPVDVAALKSDPRTSETLNRLIAAVTGPDLTEAVQQYVSTANLERGQKGQLPIAAPTRMHFEMSFAEYADLFFAKESHPVLTLSRDFDLPTTATATSETSTTASATNISTTTATTATTSETTGTTVTK